MNLTTADKVMLFLNKDTFTTNEAAIVDMLITMVDGVIKNYCSWEIVAKDYTFTTSGDGTTTLILPQSPVNSVASLLISGTDYTSSVITDSDAGSLSFTTDSGYTFTQGTSNVVVNFNAGYTTVPSDISYAASWLVAINFNRITSENIGVISEEFQGIKAEYDKVDIPIMVQHVLDNYKYVSIY